MTISVRPIETLCIAILVALLYSSNAHANSFQWQKHIEVEALEGGRDAAYHTGMAYQLGNGVQSNDKMARQFLQIAAKAGHKDASFEFGWYVANGYGGIEDLSEAVRYFYQADQLGHKDAAEQISGISAYKGDQFIEEALRHFELVLPDMAVQGNKRDASDGTEANMEDDTPTITRELGRPGEVIELAAFTRLRKILNGKAPRAEKQEAFKNIERLAQNGHIASRNVLAVWLMRVNRGQHSPVLQALFEESLGEDYAPLHYNYAVFLSKTANSPGDYRIILEHLELADRFVMRDTSNDYESVTRHFRERMEYEDQYFGATQGYRSASQALRELIALKKKETRILLNIQ